MLCPHVGAELQAAAERDAAEAKAAAATDRVELLRRVLRPFADAAEALDEVKRDEFVCIRRSSSPKTFTDALRLSDFRLARDALNPGAPDAAE